MNAPRSWPNNSDSRKSFDKPGAIQIDERLLPPAAVAMQPVRENPFARPGLALDEDRAIGRDDFADVRFELSDGGAGAGERIEHVARFFLAIGLIGLPAALRVERAVEDDQQRRQLDRLRQELLRPFLDGADRELDAGVRGEHDDGDRGIDRFELRQQIERGAVAQFVVEDDRVRPLLARLRQRGDAVLGVETSNPAVVRKRRMAMRMAGSSSTISTLLRVMSLIVRRS